MRSLASAAKLLDQIVDAQTTQPLLDEIGFGKLIPLLGQHRASLSLPESLSSTHIACGTGSLRALVFEIAEVAELRSELSKVATRLASHAPQLLWILIGIDRHNDQIAVAGFDLSALRPRVATLFVTRGSIVDSDSETICALAATRTDSDILTHCRWLEILGRESVSRRFFKALEQQVSRLASSLPQSVNREDAFELALLHSSRLLFLSFLETKGWLNGDHGFLGNRYSDCMIAGGGYHRRVLEPLFFGTLNTHPRNRAKRVKAFGKIPFLNGGLFARSPIETRLAKTFLSDEALGDLFGDLFSRYRFTAREDTSLWSEAAIDPEMLGKAFECLMSSAQRKTTGAFYTPQSLVAEVVERSLVHALKSRVVPEPDVALTLRGAIPSPQVRRALLDNVDSITILDPACGSGAFLVHAMEQVSTLRVRLGDSRPLHVIRREILTRSIFGVDINPTAVWLCELRLWLSMTIEDPEVDPLRVTPLPNLDRNIRVGDSLSGDSFTESAYRFPGRRIARMRARYTRATGPRKRSLARALDAVERDCASTIANSVVLKLRVERREILSQVRARDLFGLRPHPGADTKSSLARIRNDLRAAVRESRRLADGGALPFSFAARFADVAACGGFNIVVGNPPWVRTHNLEPRSRFELRQRYAVYRDSPWIGGSDPSGAGKGFGSQVDVSALFIERSMELLQPGGTCGLIVPSKLWRSLAGGGVRSFLMERASIHELHDLSNAPDLFDAVVYPSILVAGREDESTSAGTSITSAVVHRQTGLQRWCIPTSSLPFDESRGSPWLLLPQPARQAFDRVIASGIPFAQSAFGRPLLGVKTGYNEAFVLEANDVSVEVIEPEMIRPLLRGDAVTRWRVASSQHRIVWTHGVDGLPMKSLPTRAGKHLGSYRRALEGRTDAAGKRLWWMLFRTESARCDLPRVVWSDIGRAPRAAVIDASDPVVPLNSCYVARCPTLQDAHALAAILNSALVAAWLAVIAEPARGNYRRYLGWTISILPLPSNWDRARDILASFAERAIEGHEPREHDLLDATLDAYRLTRVDVASLLEWST